MLSDARYEVRATGWPRPEKTIVHRARDIHAAHQMMQGIKKAHGCTEVEVFDIEAQRVILACG
jgi:hypothetical protein